MKIDFIAFPNLKTRVKIQTDLEIDRLEIINEYRPKL